MALVLLAVFLAGCGGGAGSPPSTTKAASERSVVGPAFQFRAPAGWRATRKGSAVFVTPGGDQLLAVYSLRTAKPYKPSLWAKAVPELDRLAAQSAAQLKGKVASSRTIRVAGDRARSYRIDYGNRRAVYTFLLRGRREFELVCRWAASASEPAACARLIATFRPS